jgi:hypothetical protein
MRQNNGETMGSQISQGLEPRRVNHGHSRSTDDSVRLGVRLYAVLHDDIMNGRLFVPRSDLDEVITQETVEKELSRPVHRLTKLSPKLWHTAARLRIGSSSDCGNAGHNSTGQVTSGPTNRSFQKIFAILLLIDRPTKIWAFLREGVCDADLPLKAFPTAQQGRLNTMTALQITRMPMIPLRCLKKSRDISSFLEKQWVVCVPVFRQSSSKEVSHFTASDQQSLPFVTWKLSNRYGTFGEIYQAEIHSGHCNFHQDAVRHGRLIDDTVIQADIIRHLRILSQ